MRRAAPLRRALGCISIFAAVAGALPAMALDDQPVEKVSVEDAVARGRLLYAQTCSHCHGPNMVNPGTISYDLRRFPSDSPERFRNSVINGKGGMPALRGVLKAEELDLLWAYVRSRGKQ